MTSISRRGFLGRALGGAAVLSVGAAASPLLAREPAAVIRSEPLGEGLRVISGSGCNVVALNGPDGVLLVDGGLKQHSAALLKEALKKPGPGRVSVLFNTHWHPEQTGSNERVAKGGATLIAHENTRLWLARPIKATWLDRPFGPLPENARPTRTTYTTDQLTFGSEEIEYGYMRQAHTDGDIYVHFRKANVLAAGGVVSNEGWPLLDYETGGWIAGLVAGYDRLLAVANDSTRIVPANGAVLTRTDLEAHRKMYFTIYERLVAGLTKGLGPDEVVASAPAREFAEQWGNPDRFVESGFRSLWGHFAPDA